MHVERVDFVSFLTQDIQRARSFYADTIGLKVIHDRILEFKRILDPQYWTPAPLLAKLAAQGSTFAQWDVGRL